MGIIISIYPVVMRIMSGLRDVVHPVVPGTKWVLDKCLPAPDILNCIGLLFALEAVET